MSWDMSKLSLGGVTPQRENNSLSVGRHVCRVAGAELKSVKGGVMQIAPDPIEVNGAGKTFDRITVHHPRAGVDQKAAKSVQFGKERLVALLVFGGYQGDVDTFRDIKKLNGLIVGVTTEQDDPWTDDQGVTRKGGVKPKQFGAYWQPEGALVQQTTPDNYIGGAASDYDEDPDDEIPF